MREAGPQAASVEATMQSVPSLSRVAWSHPDGMALPDWLAAGRRLGAIGRASQWWIGDWLVFGTAKFGARYLEASRMTGYDVKSLRNMRYVCSRFDPSLRRDNLNWSHHALVAALDADEQCYWLDRASADRLSVEDLRFELRSAARGEYAPSAAEPASEADLLICPNCGARMPLEDIGPARHAARGRAA
jgi:hypothetical protein